MITPQRRLVLGERADDDGCDFLAMISDAGVQPLVQARPPFIEHADERRAYLIRFIRYVLGVEGIEVDDLVEPIAAPNPAEGRFP